MDEELDFLEIQDLIAQREAILKSEQPDQDELEFLERILRDLI